MSLAERLNTERGSAGLPPLACDLRLAEIAAWRAGEVAKRGSTAADWRHVAAVSRRLEEAGYEAERWAEQAMLGAASSQAFVDEWRRGDGERYREAVLGDYEHLGLAVDLHPEGPVHVVVLGLEKATHLRRQAAPLADLDIVRRRVLKVANANRAAEGRAPLAADAVLDAAAQAHAEDMLAQAYYSHRGADRSSPLRRAQRAGYDPRWIAENIAKGLFTPDEVVERWMLSSAHRRNILHPEAVEMGLGVACGENANGFEVLWVMALGAR